MKKYCVDELKRFYNLKESNPDKIAIVENAGNKKTTYYNFVKLTNSIAAHFKNLELNKGDVVVIKMDKTSEHYAARLACFFVGVVALSLNPNTPQNREKDILEEINPKYVLDNDSFKNVRIGEFPCQINDKLGDNELGFIVYTSGSTGKPKGILHDRSMWEIVTLGNQQYVNPVFKKILMDDDKGINVATTADITFIFTFADFFFLPYGHTLHIIDNNLLVNPAALKVYILDYYVNAIICLPSLLYNLLPNPCIKCGIIAGENSVYDFSKSNVDILNFYGASECPIIAIGDASKGNELSLTLNVVNIEIDKNNSNRIYYSGPSVMIKYIGDPELTKAMVKNDDDEYRKFLSQDIAESITNNSFKVVGRIDSTVKISGKRINLNEIEYNLLKVDNIIEAAVSVFNDGTKKFLAAYYVSKDGKPVDKSNIINVLSANLPEYMIPLYFQLMTALPRSSRGKIDRAKLQNPKNVTETEESVLPETKFEKNFCKAVSKVLAIKNVNMNDDFFEIGGRSIDIINIISHLGLNDFNARFFYEGRTIKNIIGLYLESEKKAMSLIDKELEGRKHLYALPSASQKMYYCIKKAGSQGTFHFPFLIKFKKIVNLERFCRSLNKYTKASSSFKTTIVDKDDVGLCKYSPELYKETTIEKMSEQELQDFLDSLKPHFECGSLLYEFRLIKTEKGKYFFFDIHHLITDAFGIQAFLQGVCDIYLGKPVSDNHLFAWLYDEHSNASKLYTKRLFEYQSNMLQKHEYKYDIADYPKEPCSVISEEYNPKIKLKKFNGFLKKNNLSRVIVLSAAMILAQAKLLKKKHFVFPIVLAQRIGVVNHAGCRFRSLLMFLNLENIESIEDLFHLITQEYNNGQCYVGVTSNDLLNLHYSIFALNDLDNIKNDINKAKKYFELIDLKERYSIQTTLPQPYKFLYFNNVGEDLMSWIHCDQSIVSKKRRNEVVDCTFDVLNRILDNDNTVIDDYLGY